MMARFIEQLPALIGVLLGALATILATSISDILRWKRQQTVRWDERRFEALVEYARAIKDVSTAAANLMSGRIPRSTPPIDHDAGLRLLADANYRRTKAWEGVLLVGDEATVIAARAWREALWHLERVAADQSRDGAEWFRLVPALDEARDRFYIAARRGLGISGGQVRQASWLNSEAPWLDRDPQEG